MATRKLRGVPPAEVAPSKPKILIFGEGGVGKTTFASHFPKPYYIDSERGANREQYVRLLKASGGLYYEEDSLENVVDELETLATTEHPYQSVVIDSFTKLYNNAIAQTEEDMRKRSEKPAFGSQNKPAADLARRMIRWITRVDMNVILICHEKAEWEKGEQTGWTFDGYPKLNYELDLSMRATLVGNDGRRVKVTKSRIESLPMGAGFEFSFEEFANRYGKDVILGEVKPFIQATREQHDMLRGYFATLEYSDERWTKMLASAKPAAESFDEVSDEQASKWIAMLAPLVENKKAEPKI